MTVDLVGLLTECERRHVEPHPTESLVTAHRLLAAIEPAPGVRIRVVYLEWAIGIEWQAEIGRRLISAGSFEDCVTTIARRITT